MVKNDTARMKITMCMKSRFVKMKTSSYAYRLHQLHLILQIKDVRNKPCLELTAEIP